jgi:hypothetical protein
MAVYSMTVIGWRVCWNQRYHPLISEDDGSGSDESSELNDLSFSNPSVSDIREMAPGDTLRANETETNASTPKVV